LNEPGKLNALDGQMLEAIERCFCVWESEGQVKVTKGLKLAPLSVARRPESEPIMSRDELTEFTRRLSMLSVPGIELLLHRGRL
jgi:hypothetical protein